MDFRKYIRIHRILSGQQVAASTHLADKTPLLPGGVDTGWDIFLIKYQCSIIQYSTPNVNYGFQALATNMRGFSQNVRTE